MLEMQLRDLFKQLEPHVRGTTKRCAGVQRCKFLSRAIKAQRVPSWPVVASPEGLPARDITDRLIEGYMLTSESIYRVLHVPTFRAEYEKLWAASPAGPNSTGPDPAFLVQVKLICAIGAATYDDGFSLRQRAVRWVYEAQTWASEPEFKSRLTLQCLQTNILLLLARLTVGIGQSLVWIPAGALHRTAVYMGLHRDPSRLPSSTLYPAEMRRRLWNTILEILLMSSMDAGGPPFISLDDFDTGPPGNFDDEELESDKNGAGSTPVPKPESKHTQTSIAIALRKTFPARLAVAKFLNDLGSRRTYEEVLQLDSQLRVVYKRLCQDLQGSTPSSGSQMLLPCLELQRRIVDMIMSRCLLSLHIPFFGTSLSRETTADFAFSRRVVVETSLKIWCAAYPRSGAMGQQLPADKETSKSLVAFERLTINGTGFFRIVAVQSSLLIAAELRAQLEEQEVVGSLSFSLSPERPPIPLRPDLLSVMEEAKEWLFRCIQSGEKNMKGYLFLCIVSAQIDGLRRGLSKDSVELTALLLEASDGAVDRVLPVMEGILVQEREREGTVTEPTTVPSADSAPGLQQATFGMQDWDFMVSGSLKSNKTNGLIN